MVGAVWIAQVVVPAAVRGEPGWMAGATASAGYVGPRGRILPGRKGLARAATFQSREEAQQHAERFAGKVPNGRGATARVLKQMIAEAKGAR